MKKISVLIPCFNEEENIEETYIQIKKIMENIKKYDYEIIFSDNDSSDNSQNILRKLAQDDKKLKVIINNRNFGPNCSIFNGIISAKGDAVIFLTCDRQDPPSLIPQFIEKWETGSKVVWGQKTSSLESKLMYNIRALYYKIIKTFSTVKQYSQCIGIGLYDREVIKELQLLKDPDPILRNIIPNLGYVPTLIKYEQQVRQKGITSNTFFILVVYALNSLIHTSKIPMKLMIYLGISASFVSFIVGIIYLIYKLTHWDTFSAGMAPMIVFFSFVMSLQIFFLGMIGEYLLAVLDRVSYSKVVVEKERINF